MRAVLVTRPPPLAEELAVRLRLEGFDAIAAPLLEYAPLYPKMPDLPSHQALVFTSAHAVRLFAERNAARLHPVFCVGEATADAARAALFLKVFSAKGDSTDAARLIQEKKESCRLQNILHVCGADTARELEPLLDGIAVTRLPVYRANPVAALPPKAAAALKKGRRMAVLVFSARAAANLVRILQKNEFSGASANLDAVCISARAAAMLHPLPWKSLRVALHPDLSSMMEILREKEKAGDIVKAGQTGKGATSSMATEDKDAAAAAEAAAREADRRRRADRRVKRTPPDEKGHIHADGYEGPDRRESIDRRAYHQRQKERIRKEKWAFINRTTLSAGFFTAAIAYSGYFLMGPEIVAWENDHARNQQLEAQLAEMNARLEKLQREKQQASLGSRLNTKIEEVENKASGMAGAVAGIAAGVAQSAADSVGAAAAGTPAEDLIHMLTSMQTLNRTASGRLAVAGAMARLKAALDLTGGKPEDFGPAADAARRQDPALNALLGNISARDLGAAVLLLSLNELRSDIDRQQPFGDDLELVKKFAGDDPAMNAALAKLAPYAENGVLSRAALQDEFKGLAADIVMAKLAGQDVSVKDEVLQRLSKLVKVRRVDDVTGDSVDATVARAQLMLNKGDVKGAMGQLQTLQGPPAEAAAPWMQQAEGVTAAADSSDVLSQTILQVLSASAGPGGFSLDNALSSLKANLSAPTPGTVVYISPAMQNNAVPGGVAPYQSK